MSSETFSIGNKKVKQKIAGFCSFVQEHKSKAFFVCSHDNPDPDSLASAYGVVKILNFLGVENASIYYCGEISHPQNRAMQLVLNIPAKKWSKSVEQAVQDSKEQPVFIFVDCCNKQKNMSIQAEPSVIIDHHKASPNGKNILFIHDDIGACSTLVADLLLTLPPNEIGEQKTYCFDPESDDIKELSTALAIGIKTDTLDFRNENTTDEDYQAYKFLSRYVSDDKFHKIINYELPPYVFDAEEIAWKNKISKPPNLITGLGFIDEVRSDCIPYLADKMMRLQGIQTVLVYAIVGNSIRASVRTISSSLDCQNLLTDIFGEGNGGAKSGSGGANVKLNIFDTDEMEDDERSKLWELTKTSVERKFERATQK